MSTDILLPILYAGLGGTVLALIVATAQQQWSCRVFFLLALRLAIGWHFLFEGLHKVHSVYVGPGEYNRVFSSEPYFKSAPGPLGPYMRKQYDDPREGLAAKIQPRYAFGPKEFKQATPEQQASACPDGVAQELDATVEQAEEAIRTEAAAEHKAAAAAAAKAMQDGAPLTEKLQLAIAADAARLGAEQKAAGAKAEAAKRITAAKAAYARWVYSVDGRDTKLKGINNDVPLSAQQRQGHLQKLRQQLQDEEDRLAAGLGNGFGIEQKKAGELRGDENLRNQGEADEAAGRVEEGFGKGRRKVGDAIKDLGKKVGQ